jgi:hypothetical protein
MTKSLKPTDTIKQFIPELNIDLYLRLYKTMKDFDLTDFDFIAGEIEKIKTGTKNLLSELSKRGYLSTDGQTRVVRAWDVFFNVLREETTKSEAHKKAVSGQSLNHRPNQKKPFKDAPLSVLIYCLYEDLKAAEQISKPKFIPKFISDCLADWNIEYQDETPTSTEVSSLYYALNETSIHIILDAYSEVMPADVLFPERSFFLSYRGCLTEILGPLYECSPYFAPPLPELTFK